MSISGVKSSKIPWIGSMDYNDDQFLGIYEIPKVQPVQDTAAKEAKDRDINDIPESADMNLVGGFINLKSQNERIDQDMVQ